MTHPLFRSRNGQTIHRNTCRHARIPWKWATDRTWREVIAVVVRFGYTLCAHCAPLEGMPLADIFGSLRGDNT